MLEFWRAGGPNNATTIAQAAVIEAEGWDGQTFMDSQSLSADPYALMGAWSVATSRIKLGIGVANPFTRNLAVTAGAATSIQALSGGRAILGFGRGDSALAWLGYAPVKLATFEHALNGLQTLLKGGSLPFAEPGAGDDAPGAHTLSFGARPDAAGLTWVPKGIPKVPVDVAATGPKVIAMSAPVVERLTFSVGAEPHMLEWALNVARTARQAKGLDPNKGISYGAMILVLCNRDDAAAMKTAMYMAPSSIRFQVMQGRVAGTQRAEDLKNLEVVHKGYDMTKHGDNTAKEHLTSGQIDPDYVRRFAIVGSPEHCTKRLLELTRLGIDRFLIISPGFLPEEWGDARNLIWREVLPAVRAAVRG
jgi:5,10-methylenetetrahydromethanopterin reductase